MTSRRVGSFLPQVRTLGTSLVQPVSRPPVSVGVVNAQPYAPFSTSTTARTDIPPTYAYTSASKTQVPMPSVKELQSASHSLSSSLSKSNASNASSVTSTSSRAQSQLQLDRNVSVSLGQAAAVALQSSHISVASQSNAIPQQQQQPQTLCLAAVPAATAPQHYPMSPLMLPDSAHVNHSSVSESTGRSLNAQVDHSSLSISESDSILSHHQQQQRLQPSARPSPAATVSASRLLQHGLQGRLSSSLAAAPSSSSRSSHALLSSYHLATQKQAMSSSAAASAAAAFAPSRPALAPRLPFFGGNPFGGPNNGSFFSELWKYFTGLPLMQQVIVAAVGFTLVSILFSTLFFLIAILKWILIIGFLYFAFKHGRRYLQAYFPSYLRRNGFNSAASQAEAVLGRASDLAPNEQPGMIFGMPFAQAVHTVRTNPLFTTALSMAVGGVQRANALHSKVTNALKTHPKVVSVFGSNPKFSSVSHLEFYESHLRAFSKNLDNVESEGVTVSYIEGANFRSGKLYVYFQRARPAKRDGMDSAQAPGSFGGMFGSNPLGAAGVEAVRDAMSSFGADLEVVSVVLELDNGTRVNLGSTFLNKGTAIESEESAQRQRSNPTNVPEAEYYEVPKKK